LWVPTTCPPQASWMYSWISHRDDRPGEPAHRLLRRVAGRLPAAVPGRVPGGADAGCSAPHRPTARSPAVVDLGAASGPAAHDGPCRPTARRRRSLAVPHWRPQDPDALVGEDRSEGVGELGVRSRTRNLNCSMRSARSMRRERACWATGSPVGLAVMPRMWTRRVETSSTNSTYRRLSKTVSAWNKSQAKIPSAWVARNCCQVRLARRGAGSIPHRLRSSHTVLGARFVQAGPVHRGCAGSSTSGSRLPSAGSGDAALAPSRADRAGGARTSGGV
jgi:hypothetical protein